MEIRELSARDFGVIVGELDDFWAADRTRELHHPTFVHEFGETAFVAHEHGKIVGYLMGFLSQAREPVGYIHLVAVRRTHRRRGVAEKLYRHFAGVAETRGASALKAITTAVNTDSLAFHQSMGFATDMVTEYAGPGQDRVVMTCRIDGLTVRDGLDHDPGPGARDGDHPAKASVDVVRGYLETVWNDGELDRASEFVTDDYAVEGVGTGPEAAARNAGAFRTAFPDLTIDVTDVVVDGDRVAVWMRLSGTHLGAFRGHEATERSAAWDEVGFFTIHEAKIADGRFLADMFGLRKALGVIPADLE